MPKRAWHFYFFQKCQEVSKKTKFAVFGTKNAKLATMLLVCGQQPWEQRCQTGKIFAKKEKMAKFWRPWRNSKSSSKIPNFGEISAKFGRTQNHLHFYVVNKENIYFPFLENKKKIFTAFLDFLKIFGNKKGIKTLGKFWPIFKASLAKFRLCLSGNPAGEPERRTEGRDQCDQKWRFIAKLAIKIPCWRENFGLATGDFSGDFWIFWWHWR